MFLPLRNLKTLRNAMRKQGWVVTCFDFTYKKQGYYVTVTDYINSPKPDDYALVHLCFMRKSDIADSLSVPANQNRIMVGPQTLREFFGIEWANNLGNLLRQFTEQFGKWIPVEIKDLSSLKKRSPFNSQKSEFLRPELYAKFKDDSNLSFYYSVDPSEEKTDRQIIASVAARESTQLRRK